MMIVLDASAAAEIILHGKSASTLKQEVEDADWILAPYLFISEITNTFWKYYNFGSLAIEQCQSSIDDAINLIDEYIDEKELYREAFNMACLTRMPVYDMFYLVIARRNNAFLLTKDQPLQKCARKHSIKVID